MNLLKPGMISDTCWHCSQKVTGLYWGFVLSGGAQFTFGFYLFGYVKIFDKSFVMNEQVDPGFVGEAHAHRTVISTQFLFLCFLQLEDDANAFHRCSAFIVFSKATSFFPSLMNLKLVLNSPRSWGWPETLVPASQVIGLFIQVLWGSKLVPCAL